MRYDILFVSQFGSWIFSVTLKKQNRSGNFLIVVALALFVIATDLSQGRWRNYMTTDQLANALKARGEALDVIKSEGALCFGRNYVIAAEPI